MVAYLKQRGYHHLLNTEDIFVPINRIGAIQ